MTERDRLIGAIAEFIRKNATRLKFLFVGEDTKCLATLDMFETAVYSASESELRSFLKTSTINFEDGYIKVVVRRR